MILTLLADPTAGGLLFVTAPGPPDDAVRVFVDSVEVGGGALAASVDGRRGWELAPRHFSGPRDDAARLVDFHCLPGLCLRFHWVVAEVPRGCRPGVHELTIVDGSGARGFPINTLSGVDWPVNRPIPLYGPLAEDKRPEIAEGRAGFSVLNFPPSTLGLVVWSADGDLLAVIPEPQVYLVETAPMTGPSSGEFVLDRYFPLDTPVAVRAILPDSTLGPAWYVDADLDVAQEPEVEDGRYQLLNPDGSVRWRVDARR